MKYFGTGTRHRNIENVEETKDRLIKYFKKRVSHKYGSMDSIYWFCNFITLFGRYSVYLGGFIFCELLNLGVVIMHFFITDRFLNQRYHPA